MSDQPSAAWLREVDGVDDMIRATTHEDLSPAYAILEDLSMAALKPDQIKRLEALGYLDTHRRVSPDGTVHLTHSINDRLREEMHRTYEQHILHGNPGNERRTGIVDYPLVIGEPPSRRFELPSHTDQHTIDHLSPRYRTTMQERDWTATPPDAELRDWSEPSASHDPATTHFVDDATAPLHTDQLAADAAWSLRRNLDDTPAPSAQVKAAQAKRIQQSRRQAKAARQARRRNRCKR